MNNRSKSVHGYLLGLLWQFDRGYVCSLPLLVLSRSWKKVLFMIFPMWIIDAMTGESGRERAFLYALVMGILLLAGSLASDVLEGYHEKRIAACREWIVLLLQKKLLKADYAKLEQPSFMNSYQKAFSVYTMWQADLKRVMEAAVSFCTACLSTAAAAVVLFTLSPVVVGVVAVIVVLSSLGSAWAVKHMSGLLLNLAPNVRKVTYFVNELQEARYAKEIRVYRMQEWLSGQAKELLMAAVKPTLKAFDIQAGAESVSITAGAMQEAGAYLYIGWLALRGRITLGGVTMYVSAINTFADAVKSAMEQYVVLQEVEAYYGALQDFLGGEEKELEKDFTADEEGNAGENAEGSTGKISFEMDHVWFKYPGSSQWILKDVSFQIAPGEKLSLVGDNGAGKTTLVKLLMGLYEPVSGEVRVNGRSLREYDKKAYWKKIGAVFQDYRALAFTVRENVTLERGAADTVRLEAALRDGGLWDKVCALPDREETFLGKSYHENGTEFSGGEQQKLAIAQMRYKDAPVMIMDEPTANLSPMEEYRIFHQLYEMSAGKTVVFISHRMSSCRLCDRIIVLDAGEVREQGTHEELMERQGLYAQMFQAQAKYYVEM